MATRNSYHTTLKELVHYGLIPQKYIGKIPKTNISRWKNDSNIQRHVGSEINDIEVESFRTKFTLILN